MQFKDKSILIFQLIKNFCFMISYNIQTFLNVIKTLKDPNLKKINMI